MVKITMKAKVYFFPVFCLTLLIGVFGIENAVTHELQALVKRLPFHHNIFISGALYIAILQWLDK